MAWTVTKRIRVMVAKARKREKAIWKQRQRSRGRAAEYLPGVVERGRTLWVETLHCLLLVFCVGCQRSTTTYFAVVS